MDENNGAVSQKSSAFAENGGISFSGGSDNAYIKEYAAAPRIERTIEDIEKDELKVAEKQAEIRERNALRREQAKNKVPPRAVFAEKHAFTEASRPAFQSEQKVPVNGDYLKNQPLNSDLGAPTVKKLTRADLVIPISNDGDDFAEDFKAAPKEKKQDPLFARVFSESTGFSVISLITGIVLIVWNVLYIVTAIMRDMLFTSAVNAMIAQGQINYTAVFSSPALTVLKITAFILPVLIIGWIVSFRVSDGKNKSYNKKTIITIMCLIVLAAVIAVFDISFANLVMV